jgi:hypothetical protein
MSYYSKYLKYKSKYLHNKNKQSGGSDGMEAPAHLEESYPIIDFYEYGINNYNMQKKHMFKNFDKTDSCNTISPINKDETSPYLKLSTCDVIIDKKENQFYTLLNDELTIKEFYKYLYNTYQSLRTNESLDDIKQSGNFFCNKYNKSINLLIFEIYQKYAQFTKSKTIYEQMINNYSYIQKVSYPINKKIIIIGDIHGGLHTFIRLLFRFHIYNILDLATFKLNDEYVIIFLGDIVDRGNFSLEILYAMMLLIKINNIDMDNPQIIFNRGNHEETETNTREAETLYNEVYSRCDKNIELHTKYNNLFKLFSSAIILNISGNGNSYNYWLSHGGFSHHHINHGFTPIENHDNIYITSPEESIEIRWNDFNYNGDNDNTENKKPSDRRPDSFFINRFHITNFLDFHNINFIIRGHADRYYNSFFLSNVKDSNSDNYLGIAQHVVKNMEYIEPQVIHEEVKEDLESKIAILNASIEVLKEKLSNKEIGKIQSRSLERQLLAKTTELQELQSGKKELVVPFKPTRTPSRKQLLSNYEIRKVNQNFKTTGPIASLITDVREFGVAINEQHEKYYFNSIEEIGNKITEIYPVLTLSTFTTVSDVRNVIMYDSFGLLYFGKRNNEKLRPLRNLPIVDELI